ncbi:DUF6443 domain-containing protein [Chryseobacterium sp. WLY505]|uniref:DUF6443 domain-containing protein n=1 Tax=Chryseobacterium sp. WLY505 TaxID=3068892 RepID=UPI0027967122|nr:DUF6443 domain-containing protein [Chryseobacterium sp. WLY505]MDQ1856099.1 DUF6443 domain-containing protein [Chryseobacterium sp. WLY505]
MKKIKKVMILALMLPAATSAFAQITPSPTENYIYSKTCLDADCIKNTLTVQYFDGLGRPRQVVDVKSTPSGKDVVIPIEYDVFGRQVKDYLPIPQPGTQNGAIYTAPLSNAAAQYGSEKIYAEKKLENSPISRVNQVISPGNDWAAHPLTLTYSTNVAGEVKKYTITTTWVNNATFSTISENGTYGASQLIKNTVTDEDGNTTTEFKNTDGQLLLVRKNNDTPNGDTYYLYNHLGQLVCVIPPLAIQSGALTQTTLDNLCYQYRYDGEGRLVEKKVPGKGWEYRVYDKADRLVASQDANLRAKGQWLYTKYDKFGRVAITGISTGGTRVAEQSEVNGLASNNVNRTNSVLFNRQGMDVYYDNPDTTYPGSAKWVTLLSLNYYDTYPSYSFNPAFPATLSGQPVLTDNSTGNSISTKSLPVLNLVKNIEDDSWTKGYIWYDVKGRVIGTHSINHLGGYTRAESLLDFAGVVQQTKAYHKRLSTDTEKVISQTFEYDSRNRLKKQWHQVDSLPQELLAENTYNEISQLSNKKVGNNLQSIDYTYNIRGALTQVNDPAALGTKLFGYKLKYFNPQNTTASTGKYNGNITEVTWKTASDQVLRQYNYQYDALNRLKKGIYSEPDASVPQNGLFDETIGYDVNGNITSLQRNGKSSSGTAQLIDNLTYNYTGNRLNTVTDASGNYSGYPDTSGAFISYDENGNMKDHTDKGIVQIDYNFLNLPNRIEFNSLYQSRDYYNLLFNVNTKYVYRADGTKLKKMYTYGSGKANMETTTITDYLDGFQYNDQILQFVPTAEGYYNFKNNKYIYSYTDHLGNVRVSYFKNASGSAEVLEENNYYPFGLKHQGYNFLTGNPAYNYQYNGKELQKETGWSDYGARMYMSDIGRWGVIDPLAETSRRFSPYTYALNNPISFIDPDGRRAMSPAEKDPGSMGFGNGMLSYYASGGKGTRANIMAFSGQQDYSFGGVYDAKPWTGSGGGSTSGIIVSGTMGITSVQEYILSGGNADALYGILKNGYLPLTKSIYAKYILGKERNQLTGSDQNYLGNLFERQFINWGEINIGNGFSKNAQKFLNTIPDSVEAFSRSKELILSPLAIVNAYNFYEMKCSFNNIGCGTAQVTDEISALRTTNLSLGVPDEPYIGNLYIVTPFDVSLTKGLRNYAEINNIDLIQYKSVYQMRGVSMYINFMLDGKPITTAGSNTAVPVYKTGN